MAVCYMDGNYKISYPCTYEIREDLLEIKAEYEIEEEIEAVNGVKIWTSSMEFRKRDILLVDVQNKKNYLLKNAWYAGNSAVYNSLDGGVFTTFQSNVYFEHRDAERLMDLPPTPKTDNIKIYSKSINDLIGCPSLRIENGEQQYTICLSREKNARSVDIAANNVKCISVGDIWNSMRDRGSHHIDIDFCGYIEIELMRRVSYEEAADFLRELRIFMQLYVPGKFRVEKIQVQIKDIYYQLHLPQRPFAYQERRVERTVAVDLLDFLKNCYTAIPYRKSTADVRNIPYIVLETSRSLEDNFLMFYRFVECYYKRQSMPGAKNHFLTIGLQEHYVKNHPLSEEEIGKLAQEMICLRNHYVHSGYFIRNASLKVTFPRINEKKNTKDYTVHPVDVNWIYVRTQILYEIVVDIIFTKMLGYEDYHFSKHFG